MKKNIKIYKVSSWSTKIAKTKIKTNISEMLKLNPQNM